MYFGVKLKKIVNINMPRKVPLITFVPSSPISTVLLQLITHLSPSKIFICVLYGKKSVSYEEAGSASKKRDRAMKFLAINKSFFRVMWHTNAICVII